MADDEDGYVRVAAALAADRQRLAELRRSLRPRLVDSPLMDPRRFARDFGDMVQGIVKS